MPKLWSSIVTAVLYFGFAFAMAGWALADCLVAAPVLGIVAKGVVAFLLTVVPGQHLRLLEYRVKVYRALSRYAFKLSDGGGEVDHAAAEHKGFQVLRMEFDDVCNEALSDALAIRARERDAMDAAAEVKP